MPPAVPSYASGTSDVPLLGDTIGDDFDRTVAAHGDGEALVEVATGRRWTYRQLREDVETVALGLLAAGVEKGDRVGIWAPNVAEWTLVQYATAKIGVILVNINPAYRTHELEYVLNQAGIALLVSAPSFKSSDYAAMIEEVRPRCPALREVVLLGAPEWDALVEAGKRGDRAELARRQADLSPDDPINIQYTSGTTGFPKGATLSHHNILNNGYFVGRLCGYGPDDRVCIPVPFYHCFGPALRMARRGCCRVRASIRWRRCRQWRANAAPRCTACRPCSSPSSTTPTSSPTTSRRCAPGSWRARPARWRS